MTFKAFLNGMRAIAKEYGISMKCFNDPEKLRYCARFSDGMTITARPTSLKVTIRYGSGHQVMAQMENGRLCA